MTDTCTSLRIIRICLAVSYQWPIYSWMPKAQCSVHKHRRTRTIQKIAVGPARACAEAVRTKGNKQFVKTQCSSSNVKIPHTNRSKSYAHISHQPSLTPVTLSVNPGRAKALYNFLCSGNEVFKFPADTRFLCRAKALYNFSSAAETRDLNSRQIRASYVVLRRCTIFPLQRKRGV